jgi:putative CocE/NonD family hydrolase
VTVKVSEERADGSTYNIRTGIATLAFRDNKLGSRQTYTPGEIVEVTVEMLPIVWEIQPGSRIRVDISSSDFPQYSVHSNYPGVWSEQTRTKVASQKVWTGKKYPTSVIIPIL